jgi:precorrin-6B C5,15-methyltransferase / cobalt-precorrin-6B C5,C15-methyltransferase
MIHVIGIGLDGADGLTDGVRHLVLAATLLVGSARHLAYFPTLECDRIILGNFTAAIDEIRRRIALDATIVILVSGDPLFFGLGRLLLESLPKQDLTFHPHLSSISLAFNRIKMPWQDAKVISAHGRSFDELTSALQQGVKKIAVLTDNQHSPSAIARLIQSLDLPATYDFWVCENLGSLDERVRYYSQSEVLNKTFDPLNVAVLLRCEQKAELDLDTLPMFGIPDRYFISFSDRPGLMTKREVRILVLAELSLNPGQIIWDIGAGTGSVSIEIGRLVPTSIVYAIEKTSAGAALIAQNCQRFQVTNVISTQGNAPEILEPLPAPHRVFIGGSGGSLGKILQVCSAKLAPNGAIVLALATLEHLHTTLDWATTHQWNYHLLQVQLSRSAPIGQLTRFSPLNPVTIVTIKSEGSRAISTPDSI